VPGSTAARTVTSRTPPSVSSTFTIASAPGGTGAPVMIRCAVPGRSATTSVRPAGMSSGTGRRTGASRSAPATSAARTA
jgi:hypothetical protein